MKKHLYIPLLSITLATFSLWTLLWPVPSLTWGQARRDGWLLATLLLLVWLPEISLPTGTGTILLKQKSDLVISVKTSMMAQEVPKDKVQTPPPGSLLQPCLDQFSQLSHLSHLSLSVSIHTSPHSTTCWIHHISGASFSKFPLLKCFIHCSARGNYLISFRTQFRQLPWLALGKLNISIKLCTIEKSTHHVVSCLSP